MCVIVGVCILLLFFYQIKAAIPNECGEPDVFCVSTLADIRARVANPTGTRIIYVKGDIYDMNSDGIGTLMFPASPSPIKLLPYPGETVTFTSTAIFALDIFGPTFGAIDGPDNWQFGSKSGDGRILLESYGSPLFGTGFGMAFGAFYLPNGFSVYNVDVMSDAGGIKVGNSGATLELGGDIIIQGCKIVTTSGGFTSPCGIEVLYISFGIGTDWEGECCFFENQCCADSLNPEVCCLPTIYVRNNHITSGVSLHGASGQGIGSETLINVHLMVEGNYVLGGDIGVGSISDIQAKNFGTSSTVGVISTVQNNIVYVNLDFPVIIQGVFGNYHNTHYIFRNNLFICSNPSEVFEISVNYVFNFEFFNNVLQDCQLKVVNIASSSNCFSKEEGHCFVSHNYYFGDKTPVLDDFSATGHRISYLNYYEDISTMIAEGRILDDYWYYGGYESEKPVPYYIPETVAIGLDTKTPDYDMAGRQRNMTLVPYQAGPLATIFCRYGWEGYDCMCNSDTLCSNFTLNNIHRLNAIEDIRTKLNPPQQRREDAPRSFHKRTIKMACENEYWGIALDMEDQLWIWGEEIDNNYIFVDTTIPKLIDTSGWKGAPKKVVCTESSLFVLTFWNVLYIMGRNKHHELDGGQKIKTFEENLNKVYDVVASYHTVYVTIDRRRKGILDQFKYDVKVIGMNYHGCFGTGTWAKHSGDNFDTWMDVNLDHESIPIMVRPHIKAFEHGVVLRYPNTTNIFDTHVYAGKDHPSVGEDVHVLTPIDFSESSEYAQFGTPAPHGIDFIDRIIGGCLYMVTAGITGTTSQIYVSGRRECNDGPGIKGHPEHVVPFEISPMAYGEFTNREIIKNFICGHACYLVTEEHTYMFGRSNDGIGFGAECGDDENCEVIKIASDDLVNVVPGLRNAAPDYPDKVLMKKYDVFYWEKNHIPIFNTFDEPEVYKYPPELLRSETGMVNNYFSIKLRKKEVFFQYWPDLIFENDAGLQTEDACIFPKTGMTEWSMWNDDVEDGTGHYDYFFINMTWTDHRRMCRWDYDDSHPDYDEYRTRLLFNEYFYRRMRDSATQYRREQFIFDFKIRFPKLTISTDIEVQGDPWWWDAYIRDKTFDRDTREGRIRFVTVAKYPNYFVFRDPKIGAVLPNNPVYFTSYSVGESDGIDSVPPGSRRSLKELKEYDVDGDSKHIFQEYDLYFSIVEDYRVCHVPKTIFPMQYTSYCHDETPTDTDDPHYDCVVSTDVEFNIEIMIDNLCGGQLIEDIETVFELNIYSDWTYQEIIDTESVVFNIGDWLYFRADVISEKVEITSIQIHIINFQTQDTTIPLYDYSATPQRTDVAATCKFVIDELGEPTSIGFHFKLHNELLQLQPGKKEQYTVELHLSVFYEGNDDPVTSRRDLSLGTTIATKSLDIFVESIFAQTFDYVPYILLLSILTVAVVAVVVVIGMCLVTIFVCRKRRLSIRKSKPKKGFSEVKIIPINREAEVPEVPEVNTDVDFEYKEEPIEEPTKVVETMEQVVEVDVEVAKIEREKLIRINKKKIQSKTTEEKKKEEKKEEEVKKPIMKEIPFPQMKVVDVDIPVEESVVDEKDIEIDIELDIDDV